MESPNEPPARELLEFESFLRSLSKALVRDPWVRDPWVRDDVVQDAWARALETPPRHRGNLRAWLRAILRAATTSHLRRETRRRAGTDSVEELPGGAPTDELAEQSELLRELADLARELEEPYRTVVHLRFYEGLEPREIARELRRSTNTVSVQLYRALE